MKNINSLSTPQKAVRNLDLQAEFILALAAIFSIFFIGVIIIFAHKTYDPLEVRESTQKTLEYTGFDGEKHQAIVINTGQHNWVLVEKK
jgi:hypothetical protein